jgi:hypothetical protein
MGEAPRAATRRSSGDGWSADTAGAMVASLLRLDSRAVMEAEVRVRSRVERGLAQAAQVVRGVLALTWVSVL